MRWTWELPLPPEGIVVRTDDDVELRIRPVRRTDRAALLAAFERFSERSRYQRFFSPKPRLSDGVTDRFSTVDDVTQLAWAIFDPTEPSEVGDESGLAVAVTRLFIDASDTATAEATLAVVDDYQRRGLGRFLMELLISTAATHGIDTIKFEVLHENTGMRRLVQGLGGRSYRVPGEPGVVGYTLTVPDLTDVDPTAGALYDLLRAAARAAGLGDGT